MTPCSAAAWGSFSSRASSRSAWRRTSSGSVIAASCSRSSATSASAGSRSPSSSWIALSCSRRTYSRCVLSSSDCTCDWIRDPIAATSSSRARISDSRRSRRPTSRSSSSACFSSAGIRSAPAIRCASADGSAEVRDRELELLGQVRDVLDDPAERLLHVAHQRGQLRPLGQLVGRGLDRGDEVRLLGLVAGDRDPRAGLDEDPEAAVRHLQHPRDGPRDADRVEVARAGLVEVGLAAGDQREHPVPGEHVVDQLDRALLPDRERRQRVRERDGVAQRQHRQARGELRRGAERDLLAPGAGGGDLDHPPPPLRRAAAVRIPTGPTIGSSTVRTPSS